jgi:hypothetical protein
MRLCLGFLPANRGAAMSHRLGAIDVFCDAPPYAIVEACYSYGLRSPEDVRWCRLTNHVHRPWRWRELFHAGSWKRLLGLEDASSMLCLCGAKLPDLEELSFPSAWETPGSYLIGQCDRCGTIYWEEIGAPVV